MLCPRQEQKDCFNEPESHSHKCRILSLMVMAKAVQWKNITSKICEYPEFSYKFITEMSNNNLLFGKLARHLWITSSSTFPISDNFQNFRAKRNLRPLQLPHFIDDADKGSG